MIKNKTHILLVEDEAVYAMNIIRQLDQEGYLVTHASTGEQMLSLMKSEKETPDIIVMDVVLEDGTDSIEASREILRLYDIPLIFHSSYTDRDIVEITESVHNYGYIVKNPDITVLNAAIRNTLRLFAEKKALKDINTAKDHNLLIQKDSTLNSIIESSSDIIVFALDRNYRYILFNSNHNETMKQIWGVEINHGESMLSVISNESDREKAKKNFDRALAGEHFVLHEIYGDEQLSRLFWVVFYSPLVSPEGEIIGLSCFVLNNTKQRMAEEQVKSLLSEKEIMLKEVHHRIKNNMNNVIMLLNYQADTMQNLEAKEALANAANRTKSMMVLYQKLYQSESFLEISLKSYIDSLVEEFRSILPQRLPIKISARVDEIQIDINTASYIGIIINELTTNSIKYAFNEQEEGEITIKIIGENKHVSLEYTDNGRGLPKGVFHGKSEGFGVTLIKLMAKQLKTTVELPDSEGTKIRIDFEYESIRERQEG